MKRSRSKKPRPHPSSAPREPRRSAIASVRRRVRPPSSSGSEQQTGRAVGDVGERLDDAFAQRTAPFAAGPADCPGEAQPFLSVVVAVLEQVLGQHRPAASPRSRAGRQDQQAAATRSQAAGSRLDQPGEIAAEHRPATAPPAVMTTRYAPMHEQRERAGTPPSATAGSAVRHVPGAAPMRSSAARPSPPGRAARPARPAACPFR